MRLWISYDQWEESQEERFPETEPYWAAAFPMTPCTKCDAKLYDDEVVSHQRAHQGGMPECRKGHLFDEANTGHKKDGRRYCRACRIAYDRERDLRREG